MIRRAAIIGAVMGLCVVGCGEEDGRESGGGDGMDSGGIPLPDTEGESADGGEKFDVGGGEATAGGGDCPGGMGGMPGDEYSLIWIANSPEGTVSKIDTRTGTELARYWSGPAQGTDDPSRTSVNLAGDVAVANRGSGVMKIAGHEESCVDRNGNGTIETSTGPNDVLPYGTDECVLWYQELPGDGDNRHGPRPTAWDAGTNSNPCDLTDERLWVGWCDAGSDTGMFRRLAGNDGVILDEVEIDAWNVYSSQSNYGPYGGAVNANGDLWITGLFGPLARIDGTTLDVQVWELPPGAEPYGLALDAEGHPWTAGWEGIVLHFDPDSETFDEIDVSGRRMRGLQIDRNGQAWIAANNPCGAIQIDVASLSIVSDTIALPGCAGPVGVSIDIDGNVWLPDREADLAFKLNPLDYTSTTTPGLVAPYTYSDMTGAGLGLVVNPPQG